jgi:PAS domain S-box-containing protein
MLANVNPTLNRSILARGAPNAVLLKDLDGHYLIANKKWHEWFNPKGTDIVGKTVYDFYDKAHGDDVTAVDREILETELPIEREYRLPVADGRELTTILQKFPVCGADGELVAICGINSDITERKQAEEAVRSSQDRMAAILDIAPEAVVTISSDMIIQLFNQGAERIFGYKAEEFVGQPLEILMPKDFHDNHQKHVEGFENSKDTYRLMDQRQEIFGLRKDGTEFPATASVSKLEIGGEKIFTVMLHDITERKQTYEIMMAAKGEAETANRAKSEFLAAMSHELRTPLNAILGFSDILSNQYFGPINDKYQEYATDIQSSGSHLLELVNEILDLSAIEAGKQSLTKEELSTKEIVAECEKIIEDKARSNDIHLVTKIPKNLAPLYADKRAAKQILLNLLSNAVKFTPEGGKITVSAKALKQSIALKITDTGMGIPPDKLPRLTEPFARSDADPYLADQGWGLGLSITKSLVELHDGKLDIKSTLGKGTAITVTFPNGSP